MNEETCPHCNQKITDIWDYGWEPGQEAVSTECPHCEKPITILAETRYYVHQRTPYVHQRTPIEHAK